MFLYCTELASFYVTFTRNWATQKQSRSRTSTHMVNSRYPQYAIWPRDGACHANHACAALTISRSCRLAFVFFHWKCTQVLQKSLSLSIKRHVLKDTIMIYWDIWLHFHSLSGLFHPITKLRILALILFMSRSISIRTGNEQVNNFHALYCPLRRISVLKVGRIKN